MKTKIVQSLFILLCTVFAAALQDMSPSFGGVKPPFLLALTLHRAFTEHRPDVRDRRKQNDLPFAVKWVCAALLAGVFEDALSEFPLGCATGFLLLAGIAVRLLRNVTQAVTPLTLGIIATMLAAPLHEIWLAVWGVAGNDPSPVVRFFASAIPAAPAGALVFLLLPFLERHSGFDGPESEGRIP